MLLSLHSEIRRPNAPNRLSHCDVASERAKLVFTWRCGVHRAKSAVTLRCGVRMRPTGLHSEICHPFAVFPLSRFDQGGYGMSAGQLETRRIRCVYYAAQAASAQPIRPSDESG